MVDPGQKIERLYAWITEKPDGTERVCQLVGTDKVRMESMRGIVEHVYGGTGFKVRLEEFSISIESDG